MIGLGGFFRKVKTEDVESSNPESIALAAPAYYEVWGGLESANRALWVALWFAITVALLAIIMLRIVLGRPPLVIRVDGAGNAQPLDGSPLRSSVTEAEVKNFLATFEKFFTELNAYTCDSDLKSASAMMTPDFQSKAKMLLYRDGTIENLKAAKSKTTLHITEIKIISDAEQVLHCNVKGFREIGSYNVDTPQSEVVFEDDVMLRKVQRSDAAPYGLLVEDFNESIFKK